MSGLKGNGAAPPQPKSPPELYGRRRDQVKVQMLEREIGFLEEEMKSMEGLELASRSCKEVADFVTAKLDPLIPTRRKKTSKSWPTWKRLRNCGGLSCLKKWCCCSCPSPCPTKSRQCSCCLCSCCRDECRMPSCRCFSCCDSLSKCCRCPSCPTCTCTSCTCNWFKKVCSRCCCFCC